MLLFGGIIFRSCPAGKIIEHPFSFCLGTLKELGTKKKKIMKSQYLKKLQTDLNSS